MKRPDVSIIIPAYNAEKTLLRSFYSTLNQGVSNEVIIIDDASSDQTVTIAQQIVLRFNNVKLFINPKNSGVSASRNSGINEAQGKYIAFLDADDVWLPNKLHKQKIAFEKTHNCTLVTCDSLQINPSGKVLKQAHKNKVPVSGISAWKTLLQYNFIPTPTVFTKTQLVRELKGFNENLKVAEDLDLWISLAKKGNVCVLNEILVHYFDYKNSLM
ncbi:MAG: glycosyltransferase family 2 protein, partial [Nitrososphaeraceae archaeon]